MNPLTFFIIPLTYKIVNRFFVFFFDFFNVTIDDESSIIKLATSPCSKIFVSLSLSNPVISFYNRLEAVRLSSQG